MNDPENKNTIDQIAVEVHELNRKIPGGWKALRNGALAGFGSVLGAAIAIIIIGYVLNILGIIPAFRTEVDSWKQILQQTQRYK